MSQDGKPESKGKSGGRMLPVLHADAAGIEVGAEEVFVAVSPDRAVESVRSFGTFTRDLYEMADWLQSCRVRTVASTGVLLDPAIPDPPDAWIRDISRQRAACEACPWSEE